MKTIIKAVMWVTIIILWIDLLGFMASTIFKQQPTNYPGVITESLIHKL